MSHLRALAAPQDVVGEHGTLPEYVENLEEKHLIILGADANNQKGIERGGQTSVGGEASGMLQCCLVCRTPPNPPHVHVPRQLRHDISPLALRRHTGTKA